MRRLIVHDVEAGIFFDQLLQRAGETHVVLAILGGDSELIDREALLEIELDLLMAGRAESIRATVKGNEKAQAALAVTMQQMAGAPAAGGFRPGFVPVEEEKKKAGSAD